MLAFMGLINAALVFALSDACELQIESSYSQVPQDEDEVPSTSAHQEPMEAALKAEPPRGWAARLRSRVFGKLSVISAGTRSVMYKLWFLLAMDSLSDGMVPYSLTNYFMDQKFHPYKSTLGDITSISYLLSSIGSVFAGPLAKRIGLINTMVFSHAPSSAAVLFFPFPPVLWMAAALLMVRAGLNNMDQAPRAAFIAAVVKPEERTAVMGITATVRTIAAMLGPSLTGFLAAHNQFWIAFVIAGANRLLYDFGLYAMFVNTVLYEHEGKSNDLPNGRPSRDEEMVELESLADSDDSAMPEGESQTRSGNVHSGKSGLQLPGSSDRVRSRSPHRSRGSE